MGSVRKRQLAALAFVAVFGFILFLLGKTERTELYGTQGRSFEKARVLEVLEDNEQESGQYVGQQKVLLVLDSGSRKGKRWRPSAPPVTLYGAHCRPGMRVMAVNESGRGAGMSLYTARTRAWYFTGSWPYSTISRLGHRRQTGIKFSHRPDLYLPVHHFHVHPHDLPGLACPSEPPCWWRAPTTVATMYLIGGRSTKTAAAILATILGACFRDRWRRLLDGWQESADITCRTSSSWNMWPR